MASALRGSVSRKALAGIVLVALVLVLLVPFVLRPPKPEAVERLVIISPHSQTIQTEFAAAFSQWAAEVHGRKAEIEWRDVGGTTQATKYVLDRFEQDPEGIKVDAFFGGGVDPFLHFLQRDLLHRCNLPEDVLAPIPQTHAGTEVYDTEQRWFGACMSGFGILCNKQLLKRLNLPEPLTWADLGRPEYYTWVTSADPRQSGSIHMAYEIILQAYGWEEGWAHVLRIGANCRGFSAGASEVPQVVSVGEAACGMAIDYYAQRAVAEAGEANLGFVLPDRLTVVNPDGMGVLKGAPNAELAELFMEFVLSERGQKLWMLRAGAPGGPREHTLYRLPIIPGMVKRYADNAVVRLDPFEFKGGIEFDIEKKNQRWGILNDLLGACIIDVHEELQAAWQALRKRPEGDPRLAELLAPPIGEPELLDLGGSKWDATLKAETVASWSREAAKRYRRLAEGG